MEGGHRVGVGLGDDEDQPGGVEPGFVHPGVEVGPGHPALLGVVREGRGVHPQPLVLVPARPERAGDETVGQDRVLQRLGLVEPPAQHEQLTDHLEPSGGSEPLGGRDVPMGPHPRPGGHLVQKDGTHAGATVCGRHHQLRRLLVRLEVPSEVGVRIREQVLDSVTGAPTYGEAGLLGQRGNAVGLLRGGDEGENGALLVGVQQRGAEGSLGHAEIPPRAAFTMRGRKFMKSQPTTAHTTWFWG